MIMSVSTLTIGSGAATPVRTVNLSISISPSSYFVRAGTTRVPARMSWNA